MGERLGRLLALFGFLQEDLYRHLQDEQVAPASWAVSWLEGLLSQELPMPCVLRLWDTYLAENDLSLHLFVCLGVLLMALGKASSPPPPLAGCLCLLHRPHLSPACMQAAVCSALPRTSPH